MILLQLTVCAHFNQGAQSESSNMAVMEINLPSGFTVNADALPALRRLPTVSRVETDLDETRVVLYFAEMTKAELCPTVEAFRTFRVANQRPVAVVLYDVYDQSRRARSFYQAVPATLCDICDPTEEEDCPDDGCPVRPALAEPSYFPDFGGNVDRLTSGASGQQQMLGPLICLATAIMAAEVTIPQL